MDPAICFNKSLASFDATDMCDDLCAFLPLSLMHLNASTNTYSSVAMRFKCNREDLSVFNASITSATPLDFDEDVCFIIVPMDSSTINRASSLWFRFF